MAGLTEQAFARLLGVLDGDRDRAGERYEDLRRTLVRFFEWRGAPCPEEQADHTLDRVAGKLADGVEITNIGGYSYVVARLVFLETLKGPARRRVAIDPDAVAAPTQAMDDVDDKERRLVCLDRCLDGLSADSRELIVEYLPGGPAAAHRGSTGHGRAPGTQERGAHQPGAAGARQAGAVCRDVPRDESAT